MARSGLPKGLKVSIANTPQAQDDFYAFDEAALGDTLTLDVLENDDGGAAKRIFALYYGEPPADPSALLGDYPAGQTSIVSSLTGATISITADGTIQYDSSTAFFDYGSLDDGEQLVETITYIIRLGNGAFSVATATVTIDGTGEGGGNQPPVSTDDAVVTDEDTAVAGSVVDNTTDPDNDPATELTYSVVGAVPQGLTFDANGTFVFDPAGLFEHLNDGESAEITFQYQAHDGTDDSDVSTVTITINGVSDVPQFPKLDAVVANVNQPVQALINDGSLDFLAFDLSADLSTSLEIALGDADGDGDLDVFVPIFGQPNQLLINDGSGNFTAFGLPGGLSSSSAVALGDIDGDGDLDALFNNYGNELLTILTNDGSGNFAAAEIALPSAPFTNDIVLGDIDGDGDLDALIAVQGTGKLLTNDGNGSFAVSDLPVSGIGQEIALGDLDNDGDLDALVANSGQASQILVNDGSGTFAVNELNHFSVNVRAVALGDLNDDGYLDAVFAIQNEPNWVFLNDGNGNLSTSYSLPGGSQSTFDVDLADFDADGDLDAMFANVGSANQLLANDGSGNFVALDLPGGSQTSFAIAAGDINGDGTAPAVDAYGLPNINSLGLLPDIYLV